MSEHYEVESLGHKDGNFEVKVGYFYEDIHPSDLFDNSLDPDTGKPYHDTDEMARRIDANIEVDYYHHGGVLQYVLRKMVKEN